MRDPKIIVIGASAGGVEALRELFRGLKPHLNAAVFVVLHLPSESKSFLPEILGRRSEIPVEHAQDGARIEPGHAYTAPPNQHLLIEDGVMRLTFGPRINHTRPAIDPLFETAAKNYGPNVIGVILSGNLYDGTKGMLSIKQAGGIAIVQDPEEALFPSMPESAMQYVPVDYSLPIAKIAPLLNSLAEEPVLEEGETRVSEQVPDFSEKESKVIKNDMEAYERGFAAGQRSVLTCPECGGVLWELVDGRLVRYRCHTGHIYNAENLLSEYDNEIEKTFWTALRVLIEKAAIANRLAISARERSNQEQEEAYLSVARDAENQVQQIRENWLNGKEEGGDHKSAGEQADDEVTGSAE